MNFNPLKKTSVVLPVFLGLIAVAFFASYKLGQDQASEDSSAAEEMVCIDVVDPVCGADGITYSNTCSLNQNLQTIACWGKCPCSSSDFISPKDGSYAVNNYEDLTIFAQSTLDNTNAISLYLETENLQIVSFRIASPSPTTWTVVAECKDSKGNKTKFLDNKVCVSIARDIPFTKGEKIAIITVKFASTPGVAKVIKTEQFGYSNGQNSIKESGSVAEYQVVKTSDAIITAPQVTLGCANNAISGSISSIDKERYTQHLQVSQNQDFSNAGSRQVDRQVTYTNDFSSFKIGEQPYTFTPGTTYYLRSMYVSSSGAETLYSATTSFIAPDCTNITTDIGCGAMDADNNQELTLLDLAALLKMNKFLCPIGDVAIYGTCGAKDSNSDGKISIQDLIFLLERYKTADCQKVQE